MRIETGSPSKVGVCSPIFPPGGSAGVASCLSNKSFVISREKFGFDMGFFLATLAQYNFSLPFFPQRARLVFFSATRP